MPVQFLKKVADRADKTPIKTLLAANIGGHEEARLKKTIHASDLTNKEEYCPREVRLLDVLDVSLKRRYIGVPLRVTWDDGIDKQYRLNNDYLIREIVGNWKCRTCGNTRAWCKKPHITCEHRRVSCLWEYEEVRFRHEPTGATGSIDAIIDVGKNKLRVVEIKIMSTSLFKPLVAPLAEHKLRTALYLRLIHQSTHAHKLDINTDEASILYVLRGYGFKDENGDISPMKEYIVKRDDALVDRELAKAHALTWARGQDEVVYPVGVCSHVMADRAGSCPVAQECFSGKRKATVHWDETEDVPKGHYLATASEIIAV